MRLQSSLVDLVQAGLDGNLPSEAKWDSRPALGIVLASKGYPENSSSDDVILGLPDLTKKADDIKVFHAGTKTGENGEILTNGGRVLCVTALGEDVQEAQTKALAVCGAISFEGMQYRRDIGYRAIAR